MARLTDSLAVHNCALKSLDAIIHLVVNVLRALLHQLAHLQAKIESGQVQAGRLYAIKGLDRVGVRRVGAAEGLSKKLTPLPEGRHGGV